MYLHLHSPGSDSYPLPQWEIQETTGQWHHRRKDQKPRSPPGIGFLFHPLRISWVTLNLSSFNLRHHKFQPIFSNGIFLYAWSDTLYMTEEVKIRIWYAKKTQFLTKYPWQNSQKWKHFNNQIPLLAFSPKRKHENKKLHQRHWWNIKNEKNDRF